MLNQFSFSAVSQFDQCPRAFQFRYIDHVDVPLSKSFEHGNLIHSLLAKYQGQETPELTEFFNSDAGAPIKETLETMPCYRELKFGLTANAKPTYFSDGFFRGVIDLVYKDRHSMIHVVDYKTGVVYADESYKHIPIYEYGKMPDSTFEQLAIYSAYVFIVTPEVNTINLSIKYVDACKSISVLIPREQAMKKLKEVFDKSRELLVQTTFPKNTGVHCQYCRFKHHCTGE